MSALTWEKSKPLLNQPIDPLSLHHTITAKTQTSVPATETQPSSRLLPTAMCSQSDPSQFSQKGRNHGRWERVPLRRSETAVVLRGKSATADHHHRWKQAVFISGMPASSPTKLSLFAYLIPPNAIQTLYQCKIPRHEFPIEWTTYCNYPDRTIQVSFIPNFSTLIHT